MIKMKLSLPVNTKKYLDFLIVYTSDFQLFSCRCPFRGATNRCGPVSCCDQPFPFAVAHFDYVCEMMVTKLLGLASEFMGAR